MAVIRQKSVSTTILLNGFKALYWRGRCRGRHDSCYTPFLVENVSRGLPEERILPTLQIGDDRIEKDRPESGEQQGDAERTGKETERQQQNQDKEK